VPPRKAAARPPARVELAAALAWLEAHGTRETRDGMARYGIPSTRAYGVTVGATKAYAKQVGKDHALAQALWSSGWYEARLLASFVDDAYRHHKAIGFADPGTAEAAGCPSDAPGVAFNPDDFFVALSAHRHWGRA